MKEKKSDKLSNTLEKKILGIKKKFFEKINSLKIISKNNLRKIKNKYIGKKGLFNKITKKIPNLVQKDRKRIGILINLKKKEISNYNLLKKASINFKKKNRLIFDPFFSSKKIESENQNIGTIHPINQTKNRIFNLLQRIGFKSVNGTEISTEKICFDALNIPKYHPSRSKTDTFFLKKKQDKKNNYLLRTHTSTVQIQTMMNSIPPIQIKTFGKCFRRDSSDKTHQPNFHQIEVLYINKKVSIADLKSIINYVLNGLFGKKFQIRIRHSFFPFTSPSFEVDLKIKSLKKKEEWIEIMGCGMVDVKVLKFVNYDSRKWSGFALGIGIERIAMILHEIKDIRHFYENDLRFLNQF
jgi:phenylalanyl-tRNA synthetase alpha chain